MENAVNIQGLGKAAVLTALYNVARPQGRGVLHATSEPMTEETATVIIAAAEAEPRPYRPLFFEYLNGRVLKIDLSGDELDPWLFDRDNGPGACADAIARLRAQLQVLALEGAEEDAAAITK